MSDPIPLGLFFCLQCIHYSLIHSSTSSDTVTHNKCIIFQESIHSCRSNASQNSHKIYCKQHSKDLTKPFLLLTCLLQSCRGENSSITDSAPAGQTLKKWEEEEEECVGRSVPFFLSLALLDVCTRPSETYPSIGVAPDPRECSGGDGGLLLLLALLPA